MIHQRMNITCVTTGASTSGARSTLMESLWKLINGVFTLICLLIVMGGGLRKGRGMVEEGCITQAHAAAAYVQYLCACVYVCVRVCLICAV